MAKSFDALVKRTTSKRTQERGQQRAREMLSDMLLSEVRKLAGKSQREVADALGIRQPSYSKLERQSEMQISTLQRIVAALGGELNLVLRLPKGTFYIQQFDGTKKPRRNRPTNPAA
jgi:transcriptional regulator with XRE-family HTH domain